MCQRRALQECGVIALVLCFRDKRMKKLPCCKQQGSFKNPAIPTFTLVCTIIGSKSLTSVFGMGTGRTFPIWLPERRNGRYFADRCADCLVVENKRAVDSLISLIKHVREFR